MANASNTKTNPVEFGFWNESGVANVGGSDDPYLLHLSDAAIESTRADFVQGWLVPFGATGAST